NALYDQPVNDWQNYDARIDAVTTDTLRAFARTYFKKALRSQLIVTPRPTLNGFHSVISIRKGYHTHSQ
ncbi:MAG: hypothetical protein LBI02_07465, partial [Opitutaceae bacterium]|nr:hypothetical protein [Opitutaceae bacterium]